MKPTTCIVALLMILIPACGDSGSGGSDGGSTEATGGESSTGADGGTSDGQEFTIQDGPVKGVFADESWEYTRGVTDWFLDVALCSDTGAACDPCEGKQLNFRVPDAPSTVVLDPGGAIINFYDGGGGNVNAAAGKIVFESIGDKSITGGLYVKANFTSKKYEVGGHFEITVCD
jgi:hypothetical protein